MVPIPNHTASSARPQRLWRRKRAIRIQTKRRMKTCWRNARRRGQASQREEKIKDGRLNGRTIGGGSTARRLGSQGKLRTEKQGTRKRRDSHGHNHTRSIQRGGQDAMTVRLQVMKFGGTSVGDAACITRTAEIIAKAAKQSGCVTVVSAMSGVTNRLIEAAKKAQAGNADEAAAILDALRRQHESALASLVPQEKERARISQRIEEVLAEGRRLCDGTALLRELTPRTLDAISSLGERLSAPLVAAAVRELGLPSEAIEATELIVTDAFHGGAEPQMELTRAKSQARLRPLLEKGI